MINFLSAGDFFGEIALFTKMKRSTSIVLREACIFQTLSRENLEHIQEKFPTLYERIYEHMFEYLDEDIMQKM